MNLEDISRASSVNEMAGAMTMAHLFTSGALRHPKRPALVADGVRLNFSELDAQTNSVAAALHARGIGRGSTVATLLLDGLAMVELLIATAKLGATIVTLNWRLAPPELRYIINDAKPTLIFASECFRDLAMAAAVSRALVIIPDRAPQGVIGVLGPQQVLEPKAPAQPDDRWLLIYTSGTTGRPKGCQHRQSGYYVNCAAGAIGFGLTSADRGLIGQPLFHVGGLHLLLSLYTAGACAVILPRALPPDELLELTLREEITFQTMPVLGMAAFAALQRTRRLPLKLRAMVGGGGIVRANQINEVQELFGAELILSYGQSEGGGFMAFMSGAEQAERPTAFGKPALPLIMRIVDDENREMPDGQAGELVVRGASLTTGYLGLPKATGELFAEGWLHTGDICWRDADGYFHFGGRKKELIKTGGENVYPAEVEEALNMHAQIVESCVVGVQDARYGEAVKAFVVLAADASLTPREVADWCRGRIAGYKRPRFVEFVQAVVRDFQGKPRRTEMAALPTTSDQIAE